MASANEEKIEKSSVDAASQADRAADALSDPHSELPSAASKRGPDICVGETAPRTSTIFSVGETAAGCKDFCLVRVGCAAGISWLSASAPAAAGVGVAAAEVGFGEITAGASGEITAVAGASGASCEITAARPAPPTRSPLEPVPPVPPARSLLMPAAEPSGSVSASNVSVAGPAPPARSLLALAASGAWSACVCHVCLFVSFCLSVCSVTSGLVWCLRVGLFVWPVYLSLFGKSV